MRRNPISDLDRPRRYELIEAGDERRLLVLQKKLARLKLLIIDELGFVPLSKTGAELLFEVFSQRYETGSVLVTTNLPFDEWTEVLGSERLTGALLDRLTHHVHILRDERPELPPKAEPAGHNTAVCQQPCRLLAHSSPTPDTTSHCSRRGPHVPVISGCHLRCTAMPGWYIFTPPCVLISRRP